MLNDLRIKLWFITNQCDIRIDLVLSEYPNLFICGGIMVIVRGGPIQNYKNCQNCPKLSKIVKIVKIVKNCQNLLLSKLVIVRYCPKISKLSKIVEESLLALVTFWHVMCSKIKSGSLSQWVSQWQCHLLSCPQTLSGQLKTCQGLFKTPFHLICSHQN